MVPKMGEPIMEGGFNGLMGLTPTFLNQGWEFNKRKIIKVENNNKSFFNKSRCPSRGFQKDKLGDDLSKKVIKYFPRQRFGENSKTTQKASTQSMDKVVKKRCKIYSYKLYRALLYSRLKRS